MVKREHSSKPRPPHGLEAHAVDQAELSAAGNGQGRGAHLTIDFDKPKGAAVGTPVTRRPPHRPRRAGFPHRVPRLYSHTRKT